MSWGIKRSPRIFVFSLVSNRRMLFWSAIKYMFSWTCFTIFIIVSCSIEAPVYYNFFEFIVSKSLLLMIMLLLSRFIECIASSWLESHLTFFNFKNRLFILISSSLIFSDLFEWNLWTTFTLVDNSSNLSERCSWMIISFASAVVVF